MGAPLDAEDNTGRTAQDCFGSNTQPLSAVLTPSSLTDTHREVLAHLQSLSLVRWRRRRVEGAISSERTDLLALSTLFPWIPSALSFRPTPEQQVRKEETMRDVAQCWKSQRDFILCSFFGLDSKPEQEQELENEGSSSSSSSTRSASPPASVSASASSSSPSSSSPSSGSVGLKPRPRLVACPPAGGWQSLAPRHAFCRNQFPYQLPEGEHWLLWYPTYALGETGSTDNSESESDSASNNSSSSSSSSSSNNNRDTRFTCQVPSVDTITADLRLELDAEVGPGRYDFGFYINPRMTLPDLFHVQVFVKRL
jgi:hypothetical protein